MFFTTANSNQDIPGAILDPSSLLIITKFDIRTFDNARQMLGDLNDDWNAYQFSKKHRNTTMNSKNAVPPRITNNERDATPLQQSIDKRWNTFKSWSTATVNLVSIFDRILEPEKAISMSS
jgi:hypothetical protein